MRERKTAFLGAEACLLVGSVKNAQRNDYRFIFREDARCETLRIGVFQGGAAFILVSSFASKLNAYWSEEEEEGAGANEGNPGAYTPI
ncbi:unnamed protein product [Linum trigynum]|uniref:Uncharacterized protein n=1 Tax=Linum trigynum TaxID=586398 RepID=A0AAV2CIB0_9ROSI